MSSHDKLIFLAGVRNMANAYAKAVYFGIIAGMRSMSAPALVSHHYAKENSPEVDDSLFNFMSSAKVAGALKVLAAGEIFADKSTFIPNRIDKGPLAFRAISGSICGATLCAAERERVGIGAIAGGIAAIASAFACYHLRRTIGENTNVPDILLGVAEDAIVVGLGSKILKD
ncbi:MAG: DUF4126 family protein [Saprospiraceae bacterium]|nr:DUF4126 family protein [Pyrinomonadaceae bacterium]